MKPVVQLIKRFFSRILDILTRPASKFFSFIWLILSNKDYWAGLFPTLILALAAWYGLSQTRSQLKLLQEQISYVRHPKLHFLVRQEKDGSTGLYIANIGNDTVQNVSVRLGLFLVTETEIYSYGELQWPPAMTLSPKPTPPRRSILPLLILAPNQEGDFTRRLKLLNEEPLFPVLLEVFQKEKEDKVIQSKVQNEMFAIRDSLKGDYVLYAEYFCRRKTDFVEYADTTYFRYVLLRDFFITNLNQEVGGFKVINRLRTYLQYGPQLSIVIKLDAYEIYKYNVGSYPVFIRRIPRKKA